MAKKKINPILLLLGCMAFGILGVYCGFLAV